MLIEPETGSIVNYHVIDTRVSKTATKKLTQEQGIPVEDWLTHISINGSNGKVMGSDLNEKVDGVMTDPKKAISQEQAAAALLKKYPLQLQYILQEEGKASLVYTLPMLFDAKIDALTGEFYTYGPQNKNKQEEPPSPPAWLPHRPHNSNGTLVHSGWSGFSR
ncbi:PepSY domain-containing protein [Brevibacillus sp. NPDC058079]|uniref:PepSY domain-containing protein n=1 Tax=Brevibacillus sp. NPDC058079 TaxID=3346330 RepID=UPI0036E76591